MTRMPVKSSNITAIGHDAATGRLHVEFKGAAGRPGRIYEYPDVSAEEHAALIAAPSIGTHFHENFRSRGFTRLR